MADSDVLKYTFEEVKGQAEFLLPRNYWKPHFVIKTIEHDGVTYYESGICEVHYNEEGDIQGWTKNHQDISFTDEEIDFSIDNSTGLLKKYSEALKNTVFIEKIDDNGETFLEEYKE